jgi:hypothetical protein
MKQKWGLRNVYRSLQYEGEEWVSIVSNENWKLRVTRRGVGKGRCPLCNDEENEIYIYC